MIQIKTLRVRFAVWTTLLILALIAAFSAFVYFNLSNSLTAAVDTSLAVSAAQLPPG
jgi:Flp pilus assembly protein TadG